MILFILSCLIVTIFFINDAIPMYFNKKWKQFLIYTSMMAFILLLIILEQLFNISMPSPAEPIKEVLIILFGKQ